MAAIKPFHRPMLVAAFCSVIYAVLAFLIHLRWYPIGDIGVEADFYAELAVSAQRLLDGQFAVSNYPFKGPLYSFVLVAIHSLAEPMGADWYRSAVLLNALCAASVLLISYQLLRRLFGSGIATAATISTGLTMEFFLHSHKASSDLLYLLLFMATVLAVVGARSWRRLVMAGALAGLAFLTRYSGGVLLGAGLVAIIFVLPQLNGRLRWIGTTAYILGFFAVTTPWFASNLAFNGHLLNDGNLMNVVQEFYGGDRAASIPPEGFRSLIDLAAHDPVLFMGHYLKNIPLHFSRDMAQVLGLWIGPLVIGGFLGILFSLVAKGRWKVGAQRWHPSRDQMVFFLFAASSFLGMCLVFHLPRFSFPLVPAYFAMAYGAIFGFNRTPLNFKGQWRTVAVASLVVVALATAQVRDIIKGERYYIARRPLEVLAWAPQVRSLAEQTGSRNLMARKPHLAHYAGLDPIAYPQIVPGYLDFLRYAFDHHTDLIAVGEMERDIVGETMILNSLSQAVGMTHSAALEGLDLFHFDRSAGYAASALVPEIFELGEKSALAKSYPELPGSVSSIFNAGFDLGVAYMSLGQWQEALGEFVPINNLAQNNPGTIGIGDRDYLKVRMAFCYLKLKDPAPGLALLGENLSELGPVSDAYLTGLRHFVLGRLLFDLLRRDGARRHLRLAYDFYSAANHQNGMNEARLYLRELAGPESESP